MRVLFITATRIGDAVLSTGVLGRLVEDHPAARFTIACGPLAASLFAAVPRLERVIVLDKKSFGRHWLGLWRQTRGVAWDLVVDLRRSLVPLALRAARRRTLGPTDDTVHRAEFLPSVLGVAGPLPLRVFSTAAHAARAAALLPGGPPVLALAPAAARPEKTWPVEKFAALAQTLISPGGPCAEWRVAVLGGAGDAAAARPLLEAVPAHRLTALFGEPDLLAVHGVLARCRAFIGNDSGLAHLAAAAGIPVLALFGPTSATHYAPWGPQCRVIQAPGNDMARLDVDAVVAAFSAALR